MCVSVICPFFTHIEEESRRKGGSVHSAREIKRGKQPFTIRGAFESIVCVMEEVPSREFS